MSVHPVNWKWEKIDDRVMNERESITGREEGDPIYSHRCKDHRIGNLKTEICQWNGRIATNKRGRRCYHPYSFSQSFIIVVTRVVQWEHARIVISSLHTSTEQNSNYTFIREVKKYHLFPYSADRPILNNFWNLPLSPSTRKVIQRRAGRRRISSWSLVLSSNDRHAISNHKISIEYSNYNEILLRAFYAHKKNFPEALLSNVWSFP